VSLHAQSTLQDKPVPSQSDATQKLQERVTQLESEVSELSTLVKQLQPSRPVPAAGRQSAVVHESVQGQAPAQPVTTAEDEKTLDREAGGDRSAVTGGTRVLSDKIKVKITSNPGETFLDRMSRTPPCSRVGLISFKHAYTRFINESDNVSAGSGVMEVTPKGVSTSY
jgi:hypothetical protein